MAIASDLPEGRNGGPLDMAKRLVTYLDDEHVVRQAIKDEFDGNIPQLRTIRLLRARHVHSERPAEAPHKVEAGYYPAKVSEAARPASNAFLAALRREAS